MSKEVIITCDFCGKEFTSQLQFLPSRFTTATIEPRKDISGMATIIITHEPYQDVCNRCSSKIISTIFNEQATIGR